MRIVPAPIKELKPLPTPDQSKELVESIKALVVNAADGNARSAEAIAETVREALQQERHVTVVVQEAPRPKRWTFEVKRQAYSTDFTITAEAEY